MKLTQRLVQQLPSRQEELAVYESLIDDSVAFVIAEAWSEYLAEGTAPQTVEDIAPLTREEINTAGPFGLSQERSRAVFTRANMPHFDTVDVY